MELDLWMSLGDRLVDEPTHTPTTTNSREGSTPGGREPLSSLVPTFSTYCALHQQSLPLRNPLLGLTLLSQFPSTAQGMNEWKSLTPFFLKSILSQHSRLFSLETLVPQGNASQIESSVSMVTLKKKVLSREQCTSNITAIAHPAETQENSIRVLALPSLGHFLSSNRSLGKALSWFWHLSHLFLPEIRPSLSIPDRNVTIKATLESKCS